ncbi:AraC family transcriptional regulator [Niastella yeongjuensis]|uniref:AraC family transcriptional regulator n=1 Tax=Niastella yeongjuensis TaxID=354355 RepID=A0A1V9E119_9BACT|nr:AraC family transcriptional regulator [Niastella yeongjuensis]OQP39792.1 AraC family transcriptional regulator [Niastella yeongjuensis]SEO05598.1 AraC family transcriptional regulator, transcriptional activator of pobA [Niastella yeongjuensis]
MKTIKFHKGECGVEFLLNVLPGGRDKGNYRDSDFFNTDFFEIVFFKKAKGILIINQQKIEVADNSLVFISAYQERRWELDPGHLEFTTLVFQEAFLNDFFADKLFTYRLQYFHQLKYPLKLSATVEEIEKYCALLTEIKAELITTRPDSEHVIRSLLYYLLQALNRKYSDQYKLPLHRTENNIAFQFKKVLESRICKKQRINDYAALLGVSRIQLNKVVKAQFNIIASQMMKQRLLFEVQHLLIYSGKSISEIADELGFSEPNHLMRFFKSHTTFTISQYLNNFHQQKKI